MKFRRWSYRKQFRGIFYISSTLTDALFYFIVDKNVKTWNQILILKFEIRAVSFLFFKRLGAKIAWDIFFKQAFLFQSISEQLQLEFRPGEQQQRQCGGSQHSCCPTAAAASAATTTTAAVAAAAGACAATTSKFCSCCRRSTEWWVLHALIVGFCCKKNATQKTYPNF